LSQNKAGCEDRTGEKVESRGGAVKRKSESDLIASGAEGNLTLAAVSTRKLERKPGRKGPSLCD